MLAANTTVWRSGDNWTRERVYQKLIAGHPVLALVRVDLSTNQFGHFVVIGGIVDDGETVIFNDSYPNGRQRTWNMTTEQRQSLGAPRTEDWSRFDTSWASGVDTPRHVRWAMAVQ